MTDSSPWASPSGPEPQRPSGSGATPPPPPGPPPGYGPPAGYGPPPGYGPPSYPQGPGWTPPPRPGLIPLGPLGLGGILGAAFRVLRRNPRPVVGVSLVIHAILAAINIAVTALFTVAALGSYFTALQSISSSGQLDRSTLLSAGSSLLVASATTFIAQVFAYGGHAVLLGIITTEVARGTVGEKLPLSSLWARARGRIPVLLGWAGLVILVTIVTIGIAAGIVYLLVAFGGTGGAIAGGILGVLFAFGLVVLGIWVSTKVSLVPSALVIERLSLRRAIARSWSLTRGYFWRTFGIELLVSVMIAIAAYIVQIPISIVIQIISALGHPTGVTSTAASLTSTFGISAVASQVTDALVATVTSIVSASATALIYLDLRIRKEGLDLTLMQFVDARAAGRTDLPDPYLVTPPAAAPPAASPNQGA